MTARRVNSIQRERLAIQPAKLLANRDINNDRHRESASATESDDSIPGAASDEKILVGNNGVGLHENTSLPSAKMLSIFFVLNKDLDMCYFGFKKYYSPK